MHYIILLFLFWLLLAYLFDSFTVATVLIAIIFVALIIWVIKNVVNNNRNARNSTYDISEESPNTRNSKSSKSTNSKSERELYEVYHRPKDGFVDNMNYKLYQCKGTYIKTGRKRSVKIEAFDENDALNQFKQQPDFTEPYEITRIAFPELTGPQEDYLKNMDLSDVCKYDASSIISLKIDHDFVPNPELVSYATERHIKFSYYIGKRALYDLIFESLDLKDKIAFFAFCIYRYTSRDRRGNLNCHPHCDLFYEFAENNLSNESFVKSMNRYAGNQLRFFETHSTYGTGGSKDTIAYKTVAKFLEQKNLCR